MEIDNNDRVKKIQTSVQISNRKGSRQTRELPNSYNQFYIKLTFHESTAI